VDLQKKKPPSTCPPHRESSNEIILAFKPGMDSTQDGIPGFCGRSSTLPEHFVVLYRIKLSNLYLNAWFE